MKLGILTVSDKGSKGEREDLSGKLIAQMIEAELKVDFSEYKIVPDELQEIAGALIVFADVKNCQLIVTTGGTGLGLRDVTPEATLQVVDRIVPGIPERIRQLSMEKTPNAMLSRAVCGTRGKSLIINLPGSPQAVRECLEIVLPVMEHALELLEKGSLECASRRNQSETKKGGRDV